LRFAAALAFFALFLSFFARRLASVEDADEVDAEESESLDAAELDEDEEEPDEAEESELDDSEPDSESSSGWSWGFEVRGCPVSWARREKKCTKQAYIRNVWV
jgi:hypothetical protein